ncbi:MAG: hypothetical protein ACFFCQ_16900 [Promethearchaeota archaeon]
MPKWFVLRLPPDNEVLLQELREAGIERAKLLLDLPKKEEWVINQITSPTSQRLHEKLLNGHFMLRLAVTTNVRFLSWFIESEGDLFGILFHRANTKAQNNILKELYEDKIKFASEIEKEFGSELEEQRITRKRRGETGLQLDRYRTRSRGRYSRRDFELLSIHFTEIPELVSDRKCLLLKGWGIAYFKDFRGSIKKKFERTLREKTETAIDQLGIDSQMDKAVEGIENFLREQIKIQTRYQFIDLQLTGVDQIKNQFPPCMKSLWLTFENTGHLPHGQRLQLGFFLKAIGMSLEEQLHFWYEKSVDNVGMSFNEFNRRIGYQIRHMYGLEGSKIDYSVPKCDTCITSYFCAFFHLSAAKISELILTYIEVPSSNSFETDIMNVIVTRKPKRACGRLLKEIHKYAPFEMKHPLQWVRILYSEEQSEKMTGEEEGDEREKTT